MTVEKVLSYPVGPIPTSLFHDDGSMRKTCKADLLHQLEQEVSSVQSLPIFDVSTTTYIRDGMALVQSLNAKRYSTFGDLAMDFVKMQLDCFSSASTVTDVFDRYDIKNSIKSAERERRSKSVFSCRVFQVLETRTIPDWKKFLNSGENKQSLIRFLGEYSVKHLTNTSILNEGQTLYLAGAFKSPEIVKMVDYEGVSDCSHLFSNHQEADTRMVLHAMQADTIFRKNKQQGRIVVKSPDTDVLVLLVHFSPECPTQVNCGFRQEW